SSVTMLSRKHYLRLWLATRRISASRPRRSPRRTGCRSVERWRRCGSERRGRSGEPLDGFGAAFSSDLLCQKCAVFRLTPVVSLAEVAAEPSKNLRLLLVFHPFGDHLLSHCARDTENC